MKKTLYSLMLSDQVVREVDLLAHRLGTNRSSLINQILADYVSVTTPERRVGDIFQAMEELMAPSRELVPFFTRGAMSMSLKSSLAYKYRPTVRYEVQLQEGEDSLGLLSVIFRTQSAALIQAMDGFFRLWKQTEDRLLAPRLASPLSYALYEGKFLRTIALPQTDCRAEELAAALSDYVQLFDRLMKRYLGGGLTPAELEEAYRLDLAERSILI